MLSPHERTSLFEALRPPPGMVLDAAVGTSFTLDLEALLTAPIAFALFEDRDEPSVDGVEPVGLLESIRRYASRLTLFCQAGQMAVPDRQRSVFAWLEDGVVEVVARRAHRLFHPKVWLARYVEVGSEQRMLRALCATRNLTFDTSWDTLLVLESAPFESARGRILDSQRPLAKLFRALPGLAKDPDSLSPDRRVIIDDLAREVERVTRAPPEPFDELHFHTLGLGTGAPWPFPDRIDAGGGRLPFSRRRIPRALRRTTRGAGRGVEGRILRPDPCRPAGLRRSAGRGEPRCGHRTGPGRHRRSRGAGHWPR